MARESLPILAVHSPFLNMPIQGWPDAPVARVKQSVQLAEDLGARVVVVHPPERWIRLQLILSRPAGSRKISLPLPLASWGELGCWLWHDLAGYQTTTDIKITVENMPCRPFGFINLEPHHFSRPNQLNHFQYLTLDTTHVGTRGVDLFDFYEQVKRNVTHVHLSNYNGREHQLLDDGNLPLAAFLGKLVRDGYDRLISLELNTRALQAENELALRQNLRESLAFCQQSLSD